MENTTFLRKKKDKCGKSQKIFTFFFWKQFSWNQKS